MYVHALLYNHVPLLFFSSFYLDISCSSLHYKSHTSFLVYVYALMKTVTVKTFVIKEINENSVNIYLRCTRIRDKVSDGISQ